MTQFSVKQFISNIERDLLFHIILNTKRGLLSYEQAKSLAQEYIHAKTTETVEDFLTMLSALTSRYAEVHDVYLQYANEYYQHSRHEKLNQMRTFAQQKDYDNAVNAATQKCQMCDMRGGELHG